MTQRDNAPTPWKIATALLGALVMLGGFIYRMESARIDTLTEKVGENTAVIAALRAHDETRATQLNRIDDKLDDLLRRVAEIR